MVWEPGVITTLGKPYTTKRRCSFLNPESKKQYSQGCLHGAKWTGRMNIPTLLGPSPSGLLVSFTNWKKLETRRTRAHSSEAERKEFLLPRELTQCHQFKPTCVKLAAQAWSSWVSSLGNSLVCVQVKSSPFSCWMLVNSLSVPGVLKSLQLGVSMVANELKPQGPRFSLVSHQPRKACLWPLGLKLSAFFFSCAPTIPAHVSPYLLGTTKGSLDYETFHKSCNDCFIFPRI